MAAETFRVAPAVDFGQGGLRTVFPGHPDRSTSAGSVSMTRDVFFLQHCPVCGRMLQVRVNLLGQRVYCQHCGGGFVAMDEQMRPAAGATSSVDDRVDELLERAALVLEQSGADSATD